MRPPFVRSLPNGKDYELTVTLATGEEVCYQMNRKAFVFLFKSMCRILGDKMKV